MTTRRLQNSLEEKSLLKIWKYLMGCFVQIQYFWCQTTSKGVRCLSAIWFEVVGLKFLVRSYNLNNHYSSARFSNLIEILSLSGSSQHNDIGSQPYRSFFVRMKSTLTSRGKSVNLKASTYRVSIFTMWFLIIQSLYYLTLYCVLGCALHGVFEIVVPIKC